jgi:hypothetical protein
VAGVNDSSICVLSNNSKRAYNRKYLIDEVALKAAYEGGLSMQECAVKFSVPRPTIRNYLIKIGVVSRKKHASLRLLSQSLLSDYESGLTISQCSEKYKVSEASVWNRLRASSVTIRKSGWRKGRKPTTVDVSALVSKYLSGLSIGQCAQLFETSTNTVCRRLANAGVERRGVQPKQGSPFLNGIEKGDGRGYRRVYREKRKLDVILKKAHRESIKKSRRLRRLRDPGFVLTCRMSTAIAGALKAKRTSKNGSSWKQLVPYTVEELRHRLLCTMPDGYTWGDFITGKLHIDHIIPKSVFHYSSASDWDFRRCWALDNLQLLPALDNINKSDNLSEPFQPSLL